VRRTLEGCDNQFCTGPQKEQRLTVDDCALSTYIGGRADT
jgi:hypothetical protein